MTGSEQTKKGLFSRIRSSHMIAVGLALAVTLWVASGVVTSKAPTKEEVSAKEPEALMLLRVRESNAVNHDLYVTLFGRTEAVRKTELAAETPGKVVARPVEKGTWVKTGVPIVKLSVDDRMARLREAKAKADYQTLVYESAKKLSKKQFQSRIKVAEEKAALESAKAALAAIRLDIARTTVRAPIDGYIEMLSSHIGDYVQPGTVVATVVNLNPLRVVAWVSERQVANLKIGDAAWVLFPGDDALQGTVHYISRVGKSLTRTFRIEVWLDNPNGKFPEGLTAELRLLMGSARAHRVSPAVLTLDDKGVIGIKAVDEASAVVFHAVEILEDTTDGVWISGLPERLTLITVGQEFVRAGQKVETKKEALTGAASDKDKS